MSRLLSKFAVIAGLLIAGAAPAQVEWQFTSTGRVIAVADIHGAYDAFERVLQRADVIDDATAWQAGTAHLVIVGDVLDRGADSRRALDLIIRLQDEAAAAGGQVHFVLGNHEVMNLTADLRYVAPGEYAAFAADESAALREAAMARFLSEQPETVEPEAAQAEFEQNFPPGFFAHRLAFARDGVYGEWLLRQPMLAVVDGVAFVHGGLAAAVIEHGAGLNAVLGSQLNDYMNALAVLTDAGVLALTDDFEDQLIRLAVLREQAESGQGDWPTGTKEAADTMLAVQATDLFAPGGPLWYRGNVGCNRLSETDRLRAALAGLGAERLVVGHTPAPDGFILSRMDESLLRIDTGMLNEYYGGRASALVIEDGELTAHYEDVETASAPLPQPRRVGIRPGGLSADALEDFLRRAEVEVVEALDPTATLVRLVADEHVLMGLYTADADDESRPGVAAYRLDRLLGLDMVPVTVARDVDGTSGSLQYWPSNALNERERSERRLGASAWCPLGDQFRDMYLFDALIFNEARTLDRVRYSTDNFQLLLLGNDQSFSTSRNRPPHLAEMVLELTPEWRETLAAIDEDSLTEALGDVLDRRRIRALLARRDRLLEAGR